ncbi:MAG: branched-chain amino acid transport system ATP-binding protein [Gammaproteobacteria bacterium]|jgi:branched-chain amino acid transport system ATP-binding protein
MSVPGTSSTKSPGGSLRGHRPVALELKSVRAGYGETVVLEGIDLRVDAGTSLSLLGRNGVGKSSLLATIMGHTTLHAGEIHLHETEITRHKPYVRARGGLGYVPQEREVFPSLTVIENLTVGARAGDWDLDRVFTLFPRLIERRRHRAGQLSGGEQQMLAIGRALMGNPSVLLMDEPSEGLAPVIIEQLSAAIAALRDESGLTILLVEQHVELALAFSPRCVVMERGRVVFDGTSATLRDDEQRMDALVGLRRS